MAADRIRRRLAAILASDVVGYSRLMAADEAGALARLKAHREAVMDPAVAEHGGRTVKLMGDGALVEFASVVDAVDCAVAIQRGTAAAGAGAPEDRRIALRIGVHLGDIMIEGDDIYGDGVNIAARLEGVAPPGGVAISEDAWRQVRGKAPVAFVDAGERELKNIGRPVRVFSYDPEAGDRAGDGGAAPEAAPAAAPAAAAAAGATPAPDLPDKPSVAVLPFQNLSGDAQQDFFSDGMAEDIITALSKLRSFFVIARDSTAAYRDRSVDVRRVARELGVAYVLEGSVRAAGDRMRIAAQLIDGATGAHIWAERYDREVADIFAVQDDITRSVVGAIEPQLLAAENLRIQSAPPESLDAWGCVIRGLWRLGRYTREDTEAARELLARAVALSPRYAKAHAVQAFAESRMIFFGGDFDATLARSREIARRARELDDDDPWSHFASGYVECFTGRYDDAVAWYRRALELNENFALAHGNVAAALAFGGRPDEAAASVERALRMSPRDPFNFSYLHFAAVGHFAAGRYAEGAACEERALRERPNFAAALRCLAACRAAMGNEAGAREAVAEVLRLAPDSTVRRDAFGQVAYARAEDRERYAAALRAAGLPEGLPEKSPEGLAEK